MRLTARLQPVHLEEVGQTEQHEFAVCCSFLAHYSQGMFSGFKNKIKKEETKPQEKTQNAKSLKSSNAMENLKIQIVTVVFKNDADPFTVKGFDQNNAELYSAITQSDRFNNKKWQFVKMNVNLWVGLDPDKLITFKDVNEVLGTATVEVLRRQPPLDPLYTFFNREYYYCNGGDDGKWVFSEICLSNDDDKCVNYESNYRGEDSKSFIKKNRLGKC